MSTGPLWLVFDVGCIECGADSFAVGVYPNHTDALAAAAEHVRAMGGHDAKDVDDLHYFAGAEHHVWIGPVSR